MIMENCGDIKDTGAFAEQNAMVDIMCNSFEDCRTSSCNGCSDWKRAHYKSMMSCILFKYARKLYEAGFVYAEEDVLSAYNGGYACGMEQGIEAERSRQG